MAVAAVTWPWPGPGLFSLFYNSEKGPGQAKAQVTAATGACGIVYRLTLYDYTVY